VRKLLAKKKTTSIWKGKKSFRQKEWRNLNVIKGRMEGSEQDKNTLLRERPVFQ